MENVNIGNMFSQDNINRYRKYFDLPSVVKQSDKIVDAVSNTRELTDDENMASILLAVLKLNQLYGKNSR